MILYIESYCKHAYTFVYSVIIRVYIMYTIKVYHKNYEKLYKMSEKA